MSVVQLFEILRFLGGGVCHQLPERSLRLGGVTLPLCARCTGTYLGALGAMAAVALLRRARASLLPSWRVLALFGSFFVAWGIDGLNSYLAFLGMPHLYQPTNPLRLLTGTLQGLAVTLVVWPFAAYALWREPQSKRVIRGPEMAVCVLALLGVAAATVQGISVALVAAGVLSVLGLVALFTVLNAMVLAVLLRREGTLTSLRDALPLVGLALLAALAELATFSLIRHWLLPV